MVDIDTIRFAQFNASLNRSAAGQLVTDLSTPDNAQAQAVAEIIQRSNPDILLINEFDYVADDPLRPVELFQENYLSVSQNGATPVDYPYVYIAPSNTGIASGFDLNNNGVAVTTPGAPGYGDDSLGFGNFPGQFGMVLLSRYPIDTENIRTFQNFLWADMPGALLPDDPNTPQPNDWYSAEELEVFRLSSKSHWDVPIEVNGETIHVLVSHPTPPTFDGPEDRNGRRNHDEIRFWDDYITPGQGDYIYDDAGQTGGLAAGSQFVIMGDQNADPRDGDSVDNAILQLLQNPNVNTDFIPTSEGGPQQAELQGGANLTQEGNPAFDTADFSDTAPGNLRTDYVLPSSNLGIENSAVFWPLNTDPLFRLVGTFDPSLPGGYPSSDHRLVWVDVQTALEPTSTVADPEFLGQTILQTGFVPTGPAGAIDGTPVQVGGLSGVAYDADTNQFFAISDDRSDLGPARFYTFTANPTTLGTDGVTFTNVIALRDANGNTFARNSLDPEDIVLTDDDTVFISSEGEVRPDLGPTRVTNPFINEFSLTTGQLVRSLPVPDKFLPVIEDTNGNGVVDTGDTQVSGIRNNLAFESLTITPDQRQLFTATENALLQDGPTATTTTGSPSRIIQYNLLSGQPEAEYLYVTDPVAEPSNPETAFNTNGLVDLLAIDNRGTLLALERSFSTGAPGTGNTIRIYEITLDGATDVSAIDALNQLSAEDRAAIQPVQKRLLLELNTLNLPTGFDNVEGITFGPDLPDGRRSIVLVSDNNFSQTQFTQILALGVEVEPAVRLDAGDGNNTFTIEAGSDTTIISDFGGIGTGINPSEAVQREVDTLRFQGDGLTARNLLLTQIGNDLELTFEGVDDTRVVLPNFQLEDLENLSQFSQSNVTVGNLLFNGQSRLQDGFDVFDATSTASRVFNTNSVTFLNDLDNTVQGFNNSRDVINAQGGNDTIDGRSGNDLIRGGDGNDNLIGGDGNDTLVGGSGGDNLTGGYGRDLFVLTGNAGTDAITDFTVGQDRIRLDDLSLTQLSITQGSGANAVDTFITTNDGSQLVAVLFNVQADSLTSGSFLTT